LARLVSGTGVGGRREPTARRPAAARPVTARPAAAARPPASARPSGVARGPGFFTRDPIADLEAQGRRIKDPVEKLRFLRRSLERYEAVDEKLQAVPGAPLRWLAYRITGVEAARPLFSRNPNGALDPPGRGRTPLPRRARRAVNVAALLLVAAAGAAIAAYPLRSRVAGGPAPAPSSLAAGGPSASGPGAGAVAEALPEPARGLAPERIWLVDGGPGFELYSNGLRIDTTAAVAGDPRRYRVFDRRAGMGKDVLDRPIGIVFHTSESDIWPLEESFNEKLRDSSQNLLHYLKKNRVYHYLIDRFGQVFRVVEEKDKANHSGNSVWSAGDRVYLNLNGPTIGVSFETRWEGGRALPITRAQLEAGRRLTDYLMRKWSIDPAMCVTHGLASVNPKKHLIGHHVDWARGFPFAAFSLPDQYAVPSPAVALFGFDHDEVFAAAVGEPWPGVAQAERQIAAEAATQGLPPDALRRERTELYDRWFAEQAKDAEEAQKTSALSAREPRRHSSGG
jgi:hypothetical protein